MTDGPIVVVGAGQAGFQVAASLRENGYAGRLTLVGDEPHLPYQRPPLSKAYLAGAADLNAVLLREQSFFDSRGLVLRRDPAVAIDREARGVELASGTWLDYAHLVLATGSRPRTLPAPGAELDGVFALRTLADADGLRDALSGAQRVAVIGGGFIGLEIAAVAATAGHRVTVVEGLDRTMARAVAPEISAHVTAAHERNGSIVHLGRTVRALHGVDRRVTQVELDTGERIAADVVLIGIGVVPNTALAEQASLVVDNGISVDERLLTSDDRISAIGDCASYPSVHAGGRARLESVQNAVDHARFVAARLTGAADGGYRQVPWFWTNQFDLRLQMAGIGSADDERVLRGNPADGRFSVFRFQSGRLVCVESVNRGPEHLVARKLLAGDRRPSPTQAADPDFDLKAFAAGG